MLSGGLGDALSMSTPLSIPAETFLLLTGDTGRQKHTQFRKYVIAGAALIELALRERITMSEEKNPRITLTDPTPTGDPVLDQALTAVDERDGKKLGGTLSSRAMDLTEALGEQLAAAGVLERKKGLLGTTWPVVDHGPESAVRDRLSDALDGSGSPSQQDVVLLALIKAARAGYVVIKDDVPEMRRGEVLKRIDELSENSPHWPVTRAVTYKIDSMHAAIAAG